MDKRFLAYVHSSADILRHLATASELPSEHAEELKTASRLLDYVQIEASIGPDAANRYCEVVASLLPEVEQAVEGNTLNADGIGIESVSDTISRLKKVAHKPDANPFDTFLKLVARLQQQLSQCDTEASNALSHSLMQADAEYAKTLFSAGLALAEEEEESDQASGATNQKDYDEKALSNFIVDQYPGNEGATIVKSGFISGGQSKFTLGIELSGVNTLPQRIILRGDASDRFSGASVGEEYRLQKILFDRGVIVPAPLALEETGSVFGSPFMLSERVPGTMIGHMFMMPDPDKKVLVDIGQHLAKIHGISPEVFGDSIDNAGAKTSEKVMSWLELGERDLAQTDIHSATFEQAFSWLKKNVGINDLAPRALVHGDYGLNNLMIEDSKVTAILDWEFAHIGNPAYDLGYFYFMAQALGSWELFLESYENSGISLPEEDQLNYSILLSATRLGVQCAQAHSAFNAGLVGGASAARVVSNHYVNESILRIAETMERIHNS